MSEGQGGIPTEEARRLAIKLLFEDLPVEFSQRLAAMVKLRDIFHEELAIAMTGPLNEHFNGLPQNTLAEKAQTASYINGVLRSIGLTIQDQKTRLPALLVADVQSSTKGGQEISRFRLEVRDEGGRAKRPLCVRYLPELCFMQDHQRKGYWKNRRQPSPQR